ncbi:MAG: agmatinase [Candidatus Zhuqueibacterota bacterium]
MKKYKRQFLGIEDQHFTYADSAIIIVPFPFEGAVSYGKGTAEGPDAIIDASYYLEFYDEVLNVEPFRKGIFTAAPPSIPAAPDRMVETVYSTIRDILPDDKFIVSIGGDHSISSGFVRALHEKYPTLSVIQFDAHADLRDSYEGTPFSHACAMSRIREITRHTLQLGIRSMSIEEADLVKKENLSLVTMHQLRGRSADILSLLAKLPDPVFITFDVDAFDWSVVRSTGTPEPGGLLWDETMQLLGAIFSMKDVIGFDVVELSRRADDANSPFAVAKLIYKMIGFKFFGR